MDKSRKLLTVLIFIFFLIGNVVGFAGEAVGSVKNVEFKHSVHVRLQIPCIACHEGAGSQLRAGLPGEQLCGVCHSLKRFQSKNSNEKKLRRILKNKQILSWTISNILPENLIFSHARHYRHGVSCKECHGSPENRNFPAMIKKIKMNKCIDCHEQMNVSRDCFACHK